MKEKKTKQMTVPPDGGWGWMVVLGSSIVNLSTRSIEPSFGLLFGDLLKELGVATTGAAVIMSTLDAMINFSGLFVGPLIKAWSFRRVAILGGLLSSAALVATSRATTMLHIITTYGIIGGLGFGLATASTFVALNSYFRQKRGQAVGLAMAGTATGFMAMPQAISLLLVYYDFRDALVILGGLSLNSVVGACLLQPVKWHAKKKLPDENPLQEPVKKTGNGPPPRVEIQEEPAEDVEVAEEEAEPEEERRLTERAKLRAEPADNRKTSLAAAPMQPFHRTPPRRNISSPAIAANRKTSVVSNVSLLDFMGSTNHFDLDSDSDNDCDGGIKITVKDSSADFKKTSAQRKTSAVGKRGGLNCWARFSRLMDLDLLKDTVYLNILFGLSITYVAELNFKMVVPFFMSELGYTRRQTAHALSMMAVADIAARVILPPILDRLPYSRRSSLMFGCVFVALSRSLLAEQTSWGPLLGCLLVHGFFRGMTLINFPLVISEYATLDKFPAALGLSMVSKGCFIVILGPLVGYIRDVTNSYPICIHTQSLMIMSCVVAWGIEYLLNYRNKKKCQAQKKIKTNPV